MQQLEMSARSSFEVDLFVNEPSSVSLSDKDMAKLKVTFKPQFLLRKLFINWLNLAGVASQLDFPTGTQSEEGPGAS